MINVTAIVEGDGEVIVLPILLRRLNEWLTPEVYVDVGYPIRVRRDRFLNKEDEFRRHLSLAANKCGGEGWILILFDADDDCRTGSKYFAPRPKYRPSPKNFRGVGKQGVRSLVYRSRRIAAGKSRL